MGLSLLLWVLFYFQWNSAVKSIVLDGEEDFLYDVSIRFGNSSTQLNLILDVNAERTWIFAERRNRMFTFNDLQEAEYFKTSYIHNKQNQTFDGYMFEDEIRVGDWTVTKKLGFVFRTTIKNSTKFADGILGFGFLANESSIENEQYSLGEEVKQISVVTDETGMKTNIIFGQPFDDSHCPGPFLYEPLVSQQSKWKFELKNITFGDQILSSPISNIQFALLSTINSALVGPRQAIISIYERLDASLYDSHLFPIVNCTLITRAPDLIFSTKNLILKVSPRSYLERKNSICYLRILTNQQSENDNEWTLGRPFHSNQCVTYDFKKRRVGFSDVFLK